MYSAKGRSEYDLYKPLSDASNRVNHAIKLFYMMTNERSYISGNIVLPLPLRRSVMKDYILENPSMYECSDMIAIIKSIDTEFVAYETKRANRKADGKS